MPNDPYQIATAEDLMLLGDSPEDYDKHFILTADIDLDPNLPGRKVFGKAVIAPDTDPTPNEYGNQQHDGKPFSGVFDGDGRTISHLTITGMGYLGVFGLVGHEAEVSNLRVIDVSIIGTYRSVGALIGLNVGEVTQCYTTGSVSGDGYVGGVVGRNEGTISTSRSTAWAGGEHNVGGLVGVNYGSIIASYATGTIHGADSAGGLAGANRGTISNSYSMGSVSGTYMVGGLVGWFYYGTISNSYSTGAVKGAFSVGGLVGVNGNRGGSYGAVLSSFWDTATSNQNSSDGGTGKTTAEMQMASTFLDAGWDFVDETANGMEDIWWILEGTDYPHLWWERVEP